MNMQSARKIFLPFKPIFCFVSVPVLDISAVIDGDAELPCDITPPGG